MPENGWENAADAYLSRRAIAYYFERNGRFMVSYLIVCRSLTNAQQTAAALERAGLSAQIIRSPKSISGEGCSYGVRLAEQNLSLALIVLNRVGLTPSRVYIASAEGGYREVGP